MIFLSFRYPTIDLASLRTLQKTWIIIMVNIFKFKSK